MDDLWGPLTKADWRSVRVTSARAANEMDVKLGRAVFYVPSGSRPHQIALPICAIHHDEETHKRTSIVVIQAEEAGDQTILGARPVAGGNMVCTMTEVEFVVEPDELFFMS
ncbi:MAG TPA: hypothetical protein VG943_14365 [Caulobacterales bacterium]|nr:hypothetical protein [Caulobacterales bacterium]